MARVQISIDDEYLKKVDEFAESIGLSRSAFATMAMLEYISAKKKAPLVTGALSRFADLVDAKVSGRLSDDEVSKSLDELEAQFKGITDPGL